MTDKQPIFILPENVQRMIGKTAQRNNIAAARLVADTIKTTLGPKGMDKLLVSSMGDITVTNDGVTILDEMEIEHPAAKMLVEVAKTQEDSVGDGTTTAVVLAGKLLENSEILLDKRVHSTVIARGYRTAAELAEKILDKIGKKITPEDESLLRQIAMTAMTGKGAEAAKEYFADLAVKAVKQISEKRDGKIVADITNVKLEKKKGLGIEDTELISGIVLDKERVHPDMPVRVKNAKIALADVALEIKSPETDTKVSISSPEQLQAFLDREEKTLREMVEKVKKAKANVLLCQKGIDDIAQYHLAKVGIYAVRRVSKSDMEKLAKATGGRIVSNLAELSEKDLGYAKIVEEVREGEEGMTYVRECKNPKALTILVRGGTEHVVDEIERALKDALGDVAAALECGKVVPGGGAIEVEVAKELRKESKGLAGREKLAIEEFAAALESIPATLAENAGLDPIDILTELKAHHEKGKINDGINVYTGKIEDMFKLGVVEPLTIKSQAIKSAGEVAIMILRIDDVVSAAKPAAPPGAPSQPGGGGMPPEY